MLTIYIRVNRHFLNFNEPWNIHARNVNINVYVHVKGGRDEQRERERERETH